MENNPLKIFVLHICELDSRHSWRAVELYSSMENAKKRLQRLVNLFGDKSDYTGSVDQGWVEVKGSGWVYSYSIETHEVDSGLKDI